MGWGQEGLILTGDNVGKDAEREGAEGAKKHRKSIINSNLITQIKTKIGYCEKKFTKMEKKICN